ncbi:MAG TPA: EAL domain-containing protein [Aromatoleum sp.]|uniref:putative bifunctional diguanylate cyclase/phosphodiesterase n=1 Tax=Aromatoleum sp. TaxID=2307007 RepID=UPI002B46C33D|nr:EAL domain-containing protein [Aromatoleum sp.]HJV28627.1 EAL domain-containing protein [Aromatoleum sp.]
MSPPSPTPNVQNGVLRIVLTYSAFAALWILLSDKILGLLFANPEVIVVVSVAKGWLFVAITALLLFGLLGRLVSQIQDSHRRHIASEVEKRRALQLLAAISDSSADAIFAKDTEGRYLLFNRAASEYVGKSSAEVLGKDDREIFPPEQAEWLMAVDRRVLAENRVISDESTLQTADGRRVFLATKGVLRDDDSDVIGIFGISRDVTDYKQAEAELRIAATAFESQQAMVITDRDHAILRVNQAFTAVTGYCADEAVGQSTDMLQSGRQDPLLWNAICSDLSRNRLWQGEIRLCRKNGETFPAWLSISEVVDRTGTVTNYVGSFIDISQRKQAEELIHSLSFYDALTGLPNRRLLLDRLRQTVMSGKRKRHHGAILFIDLDDFRALNDTRGHEVGDELLVGVSRRIRACVHGEDTVARLGGDEFAVVLEGLSTERDPAAMQAREVAKRIHDAIGQPIELGGQEYVGTSRIGISLFSAGETSVEELLKLADASMFQAKRTGRNQIHFFDASMQAALEERVRMESWLRKALPDQLELHYQMQVDSGGHVFGAEALIRWRHPQRGLISPAAFIPLAEETGLILPIGRWVLETACRQLKAWEADPATRHLLLAVNVSARQFQQPDFVQEVLEVVGASGADPANLKLELTESTLLENIDVVVDKMVALKARGIRFSLDDFGTGFSSLSYLKRLPLEQLKIDQSFVRDVLANANDAAIVRTIIALGQSLGLDVIAEGVETDEQRHFLAIHGCNYYQGYFFSKPLPLPDFEKRLSSA